MKYVLVLLGLLICFTPATAGSAHGYVILANINDDKLVLADQYGDKYIVEAHTYCLGGGWDRGDIVLSTENLDLCVSATLISRTSGDTCEVWCP